MSIKLVCWNPICTPLCDGCACLHQWLKICLGAIPGYRNRGKLWLCPQQAHWEIYALTLSFHWRSGIA